MTNFHESAPNPQFVRQGWLDLTGSWKFRYDDDNIGLRNAWNTAEFGEESLEITVPFPPESTLSGIGDPSFHPVVWYQRELPVLPAEAAELTLLRFGAVDYQATVWINGILVGSHTGGSSPFTIDMETSWLKGLRNPRLTLRVFDDPEDREQPRGKQGWDAEPNSIWYKRTTGIWQPVWIEFAPAVYVSHTRWVFDADSRSLNVQVELNRTPVEQMDISARLVLPGGEAISVSIQTEERVSRGTIDLSAVVDIEALLWSPVSPTLLPTNITTAGGDTVDGYIGFRSLSLDTSGFAINGVPVWLRLVLSQGYFPESHYAAPSAEAIKREVELTLALGFNGARTHQKAEDPRYLYWADRLGLLIWGEIGAAQVYSDKAINALANEWSELVRRDINHPSIIAWVPFNESWGVWEIASHEEMQHAVRSIYALTYSLDGTRPAIGNDGWEHVSTDIFSLHDYNWNGKELRDRYSSGKTNDEIAAVYDVANKVAAAAIDRPLNDLPLMITEYGGVSYAPSADESWFGYGKVSTEQEYAEKYHELTDALHAGSSIIGICYTQLTDTEQETNGLLSENREPKIDIEILRAITIGEKS